MSFFVGASIASAMGGGTAGAVAGGLGAEVATTAAGIPVYNELRSVHRAQGLEHVKIVSLHDEGMASMDSSHEAFRGKKRPLIDPDGEDRLIKNIDSANRKKKLLIAGKGGSVPPEPDDPLVHSLFAGAGTSARLNYEGAANNYCITEAEGEMVQSWVTSDDGAFVNDIDYGTWSWQLSMSQLRYMSPFKEFMTMYTTYKIRQVQVEFYPIHLDAQYVVGSSAGLVDAVNTAAETEAGKVDAAVDEVLTRAVDLKTIHELADDGKIPRVGPVAVCFKAKGTGMSVEDTKLTSDVSFHEFIRSTDAQVYASSGGMLPVIKLEYDAPGYGEPNAVGYRCPHPVAKYTEKSNLEIVDEAWPVLGTFHMRTSKTLGGIPLYSVRVKVLTEFMGVMDYPMEVPHRNPLVGLGEGPIRRRLSATWHDPDNGLLEDSDANELVEKFDPSDTTNTSYNYNVGSQATNSMIATNTNDIAANASQISQLHNYRVSLQDRVGVVETDVADCVRTGTMVEYVKVVDNDVLHVSHGQRLTPIEDHVTITNAAVASLNSSLGIHFIQMSDIQTSFGGSVGTINDQLEIQDIRITANGGSIYLLDGAIDALIDEQGVQNTSIAATSVLQTEAGVSIGLLNAGMDDHDNRMNNMDSVTANLHDNLVIAVGHIQTLLADGILMSQRIADLEYVVYTRTSAAIVVQSGISGTSRLFQRTDTWFNTSTGASVELPLLPGGSYKCKFVMSDTTSSQSGLKGFAGVFDLMLPTVTSDVNHSPYLDVPCSFFHNDSTHGVPLIQFRPTSQNQWNLFLTWPSPDSTKTADSFTLDLTMKSMNW